MVRDRRCLPISARHVIPMPDLGKETRGSLRTRHAVWECGRRSAEVEGQYEHSGPGLVRTAGGRLTIRLPAKFCRRACCTADRVRRSPWGGLAGIFVALGSGAPWSEGLRWFLYMIATAVIAVILGLVFGVPRARSEFIAGATERYAANSNLEQISDWLTKLLVGAGLVQLTSVPGRRSRPGDDPRRRCDRDTSRPSLRRRHRRPTRPGTT